MPPRVLFMGPDRVLSTCRFCIGALATVMMVSAARECLIMTIHMIATNPIGDTLTGIVLNVRPADFHLHFHLILERFEIRVLADCGFTDLLIQKIPHVLAAFKNHHDLLQVAQHNHFLL